MLTSIFATLICFFFSAIQTEIKSVGKTKLWKNSAIFEVNVNTFLKKYAAWSLNENESIYDMNEWLLLGLFYQQFWYGDSVILHLKVASIRKTSKM
jgi:hypothetical protein